MKTKVLLYCRQQYEVFFLAGRQGTETQCFVHETTVDSRMLLVQQLKRIVALSMWLREGALWCTLYVKQSHYRPGPALRVPGDWSSLIWRQSTHEGGEVVGPTHQPPLPPRIYSWYSFLLDVESAPGSPCGRIRSMKNSNDIIENRTHDLSACSAVPQPTAPPRTRRYKYIVHRINTFSAIVHHSRFNNSYLKSPASTLVDLTFQSRALRSFSLNQIRNLSL